jgi:hypothetical protein
MLTRVLTLLEQHHGGLNVQELSRRLDVQPGALEGMLELLVSKQRLVKIGAPGQLCQRCPLNSGCGLTTGGAPRYVLVRRCPLPDQGPRP